MACDESPKTAASKTVSGQAAPRVILRATARGGKINDAIWAALPQLLERCHVLHVTGAADEALANEQRTPLNAEQQARYHVRGYMDEMPAALIAADVVVARSGASTLGELPAAGTPGVLIPGEYEGWSQAPNAEFLQAEGAAVMLRNSELDRLPATVLDLLSDDARLASMSAAARRLGRPEAARDLAHVLMEAAA
jgi:UDP-N-acetylglucosamine--N-acetylmuramyl-(pentapeptide) pyrophosphoryl-undecaprenol N-acetylglucosamine transferase